MFTHYRKRLHLKKVNKGIAPRNYQDVEWQSKRLQAVGILLHANIFEDANFQRFLQRLEQQFHEVHIIGFLDKKVATKQLKYPIFTKKELDWLWKPTGTQVSNFKNNHFDLLINLCQQNCLPLEYLAVISKANYKIGATTDYPNQYDLILKTDDFKSYLDQINFFLKKLRSSTNAVIVE